MKSFAIVIRDNDISEKGYKQLLQSSAAVENSFDVERFDAITPHNVNDLMTELNVKWAWPLTGSKHDEKSGITKRAYGGKDPKRRIACGMSHYMLWKKCVDISEPLLILEHDAVFIYKLQIKQLIECSYAVIGLNDPRGNTRLANKFHSIVQNTESEILPVPEIDKLNIAQGLAGNSAYLIKPLGAKKLLDLVDAHGMWPNDAIMCKQLMPNMIGVTKIYYTDTQRIPSTTMG